MRRLRLEQSQLLPKPQGPPNPQGGPGLPLDQADAAYRASSEQIAASRATISRLEQALAAEQSKMKCGEIVDKVAETGLSSLERMSTSGAGALDSMSARLSEAIAGLRNPPTIDLESLKAELRQISDLDRQSAESRHESDQTENRTLRERIEQLLQQNGSLTADVTRLTQELIELRRAFEDAMRQTQQEHEGSIRILEERIRELMRENVDLGRFKERFGGQEDGPSYADLMGQIQQLQAENDQLRAMIQQLQEQLGEGGADLARQLEEARRQQRQAEEALAVQVGQKNARIQLLEAQLRRAGQNPDGEEPPEGEPPEPPGDAALRARIAELEAQAAGEQARIEAAKQQAKEDLRRRQIRTAQIRVTGVTDEGVATVNINKQATQGPWLITCEYAGNDGTRTFDIITDNTPAQEFQFNHTLVGEGDPTFAIYNINGN
jgi:DNA repair exonuclease SbcCD ATPase subunit